MIIKLINSTITDTEQYKAMMIMNSDSTAALKFFKHSPLRSLEQLTLVMQLGDVDEIHRHVTFRYKLMQHQLRESQKKL